MSTVNEVINNRDGHIDTQITPANFLAGHDLVVCAGPAGATNSDDYYVIGLAQSMRRQDQRSITNYGELGSNATIALFGDSTKQGSLNRIFPINGSLLYGMFYPTLVAPYMTTHDFLNLSQATAVLGSEEPLSMGDISAKDIVGGSDVILCVAESPNSAVSSMKAISMVQSIDINSNISVVQYPEIGCNAKYVLGGKGSKSMTLQRLESDLGNIIYEMYHHVLTGTVYSNDNKKFLSDLNKGVFKEPIHPVLVFLDGNGEHKSSMMLQNAHIASVGTGGAQGQPGSLSSLNLTWGNTKYIGTPIVGVPNSLRESKLWLDLDNKNFRNPINIRILHLQESPDEIGAASIICTETLENALVTNIATQLKGADKETTENCGLVWEKTILEEA